MTLDYRPPSTKFEPDKKIIEIPTGFGKIDKIIGGLRTQSTFVLAGNGKSGKSSFLMDILNNRMTHGHKVGLINTELSDSDIFNRLTGIYYNKSTKEVEEYQTLVQNWFELVEPTFFYVGLNDLKVNNYGLSFDKAMEYAKSFAEIDCKIIAFDNISTFSTQLVMGKQGWQILDDCLTKIINFSKTYDVASIVIIHTTKGQTFKETPEGIRNLILNGETHKLFTDSISVVGKPTLDDVRGGVSLTQISGAILIWRPMQYYADPELSKQSQIVLEQFRYSPDGSVSLDYLGDKKMFVEVPDEFDSYVNNLKETL